MSEKILIAVTGASGSVYATRMVYHLERLNIPCELVFSKVAKQVVLHEKQGSLLESDLPIHSDTNLFAAPASGTSKYRAMIVLPCSMGTLGRISAGLADSLITRAADVFIKENRDLVLVPREMPFSTLHLENMLRLRQTGVNILPASPFFYQQPKSIEELVDTVIGKIFDLLRIDHQIFPEWGSRDA